MTGGDRDVMRIIDRLTGRVDRLENKGEAESTLATTEDISETVALADSVDVTLVWWGDDRFRPGFGRDAFGFGREEPGLSREHSTHSTED